MRQAAENTNVLGECSRSTSPPSDFQRKTCRSALRLALCTLYCCYSLYSVNNSALLLTPERRGRPNGFNEESERKLEIWEHIML